MASSTIKLAIFNSYVSLPEGKENGGNYRWGFLKTWHFYETFMVFINGEMMVISSQYKADSWGCEWGCTGDISGNLAILICVIDYLV